MISQFSILNSQFSLRRLLAVSTLLVVTGCFESPVEEKLTVSFESDGTAIVLVNVEVAENASGPEMAARLDAIRAELLEGRDPWARRFESVRPKEESFTWQKSQGKLVRVERIVRFNAEDLGRLFFDTSLEVRYREESGIAALEIFAGASQRATREQARQFEDAADSWSRAVAGYYDAIDELYRYTAAYPDRAEGMFAIVFESEMREGEHRNLPQPVTDEERVIAERVVSGLDDIAVAQTSGRELSADELARLVNDPFPAEFLVRIDGEIDEIEGFERDDEGKGVRVPRKGLLDALDSMRWRWASPDPFQFMLDRWRLGDEAPPFDLAEFLAIPRTASPPAGWKEVRKALDEALRPAATYRVKWKARRGAPRIEN